MSSPYAEFITSSLQQSARVKEAIASRCVDAIAEAAQLIGDAFQRDHKLLLCGNGGSAADAQHIATEFVIRYTATRERRALPAIALTTDTSILTAGGNDYGFDTIFARQVEALAQPGDMLIAISTSGNSENVIRAVETARKKGLKIVTLLGGTGGTMKDRGDINIVVPADETSRIQEGHITVCHILCELVEQILFDQ